MLGGVVDKLFGNGDYTTSSHPIERNILFGKQQEVPMFAAGRDKVVIVNREYLGDVVTSATAGAFSNTSYFVNPGLASTFPWASGVANCFEEYEFLGLVFEFKSTSADALNSTNTALGTVVMATTYNALDTPFTTKLNMENYDAAQSIKPSCSALHGVECKRLGNVLSDLYIRSGPVPTGQDQRFYDLGNFQLATTGFQGTSVTIGELWVSYAIALRKPKLNVGALGSAILSAHYFTSGASMSSSNVWTAGTAPVAAAGSTLALTFGPLTVTFPATVSSGVFLVALTGFSTSSSSNFNVRIASVTNANLLSVFNASTLPTALVDQPTAAPTTQANSLCFALMQVTGPAPVVTVTSSAGTYTSPTDMSFFATQWNTNVITRSETSELKERLLEMIAGMRTADIRHFFGREDCVVL